MDAPTLVVRMTADKGRGLFAARPIPAGGVVVQMQGWLARTVELDDAWMAMQVGEDLWLCSSGDLLDDCGNHSCAPNAGFTTGEPVLYSACATSPRARRSAGTIPRRCRCPDGRSTAAAAPPAAAASSAPGRTSRLRTATVCAALPCTTCAATGRPFSRYRQDRPPEPLTAAAVRGLGAPGPRCRCKRQPRRGGFS